MEALDSVQGCLSGLEGLRHASEVEIAVFIDLSFPIQFGAGVFILAVLYFVPTQGGYLLCAR